MKVLVTYQSKTGFTKKYAEWIARALSADLKDASGVDAAGLAGYDLVIHGGWIMGGLVSGLRKIMKCNPKKLIVFGVGFTAKGDMDAAACATANQLGDIPFFYFEGGMNPEKMGWLGRIVVKKVTKKELAYADHADPKAIEALVTLAKGC